MMLKLYWKFGVAVGAGRASIVTPIDEVAWAAAFPANRAMTANVFKEEGVICMA